MKEKDIETLRTWLKLAAGADSVKEFEQMMVYSGLDKDDNIRI